MKSIILVALAIAAVAVAVPVEVEPVKTLESNFDQQPEGNYNFGFKTEDGVVRTETGEVKEAFDEEKKPQKVVFVRGSYSYPREDGSLETINYYADDTGFHAEGASIPTVPARR